MAAGKTIDSYWWGAVELAVLFFVMCIMVADPDISHDPSPRHIVELFGGMVCGLACSYIAFRLACPKRLSEILRFHDACFLVNLFLIVLMLLHAVYVVELGVLIHVAFCSIGFCGGVQFVHSQSVMVRLPALKLIRIDMISICIGCASATLLLLFGENFLYALLLASAAAGLLSHASSRNRLQVVVNHAETRDADLSSLRAVGIQNAFYGVLLGAFSCAAIRYEYAQECVPYIVGTLAVAAGASLVFFASRFRENFLVVPRGLFSTLMTLLFVAANYSDDARFLGVCVAFFLVLAFRSFCVLYLTILQVKNKVLMSSTAFAKTTALFIAPALAAYCLLTLILAVFPQVDSLRSVLCCCCLIAVLQTFVFIQLRDSFVVDLEAGIVSDASSLELLKATARADAVSEVGHKYELSCREREVFGYLCRGRTAKHIEKELNISYSTVKSHINHIYIKTNVHSQQELMDLVEAVYQERIGVLR